MSKRIALSLKAASVLFLTSSVVAAAFLRRFPELDASLFLLSISVPLIASALLVLLSGFLPDLLSQPRFGFPMNFTFPLIHSSLVLVLTCLMLTSSDALESLPKKLDVARIWEQWPVLGICATLGILSLSVMAAIARES